MGQEMPLGQDNLHRHLAELCLSTADDEDGYR